MLKHVLTISTLFSTLCLSGCFLTKTNETYSQEDICAGIKRQMIFYKVSPNITGDSLQNSPARLRELWQENNCEDDL